MPQVNQICNIVIIFFLVVLVLQFVLKIDVLNKIRSFLPENLNLTKEPLMDLNIDRDVITDEDLVDSENSEEWDEVVRQHIPVQNLGPIPQQSQVIGPIPRPTHQVSFNDSVRAVDVPNANLPQPTEQFNNMGGSMPMSTPDKYNLGGPAGPPPAPLAGATTGEIQPFDSLEGNMMSLNDSAPKSYLDQQWSLLGQ